MRMLLSLALLSFVLPAIAAEPALDRQEVEFFEKKIRPVLVDHCFQCHSSDAKEIKGKLRLDSREAILAGGESGPALVAGDVKNSLLLQALKHDGLEMPPKKKLPANVIADFERWISRGAVDPRVAGGGATAAKKEIDIEAGRKFWSLQPIADPTPPKAADVNWPANDVDRFVLAKLEESRLRPVADANRLALLRRLTFDLTGLPPTTEEIEAFLKDESTRAVERVVDRLLASPHFGERWGRHWLDVARYAESNGNADNFMFPHAWRYRDYVIAAFNADKPLDQFIAEQVAGDLLAADSTARKNELLTATGFLALTSKPRAQNNPDYAMDLVAEQIEVTTVAFMGLTVACARCHDHKFDPIPQREYYSLAAIFESTSMLHGSGGNKGGKNVPKSGLHSLTSDDAGLARQIKEHEAETAKHRAEQAQLQSAIEDLLSAAKKKIRDENEPAANAPVDANAKKQQQQAERKLAKLLEKAEQQLGDQEKKELKNLRDRLAALDKQIKDGEKSPPAAGYAMGLAEAGKLVNGRVRIRGESQKLGDSVDRGFVSVGSLGSAPAVSESTSGRLELAQWITSRENPLTARVLANRIWRHLFGRGLVATVDNFGVLGEKPSHPELLDHLATRLAAEGWSTKKLIRYIVLSRTYQLSSAHDEKSLEVDPDNRLYWRHSVRRLDAESLRDAILATSGQLDRSPAVRSPVADEGNPGGKNGGERKFASFEFAHRSVYLPMVRNAEPEMLVTFDLPDTELVVGDRSVTTVPAQSLFLLNSRWIGEQSAAFAARVLAAQDLGTPSRLQLVYRLALARPGTPAEIKQLADYLAASGGETNKAAWQRVCQAVLASSEFRYVE